MGNEEDYGYFGEGDEGYAHYIAASGEDESDPDNENDHYKEKSNNGCLIALLIILFILALINALK